MATAYTRQLGKKIPQTEALPGQVPNSAGAFSFRVDDWTRLDRFLILGSEGGSYYASERKLTLDNVNAVERCAQDDGLRTVRRIVEISDAGRAPKNDPALLALAIVAKMGDTAVRQSAYEAVPKVARIGTHLFHFADYLKLVGHGWGRGTKRAFANWYLDRPVEKLAMQAIKYQERDGWRHRDILRLAHPKTADEERNAVLRWIVKGDVTPENDNHNIFWAFECAKRMTAESDVKNLCALIDKYSLPHECVPNEMKQFPAVWEAMLPQMGLTALIRNLGKMTSIGLIAPLSSAANFARLRLGDLAALKSARIHPLNILTALKIYTQGHGDKGKLTWSPLPPIIDALDSAFYSSFKTIEPTGKRHLLALDVSASMGGARIAKCLSPHAKARPRWRSLPPTSSRHGRSMGSRRPSGS